MTGVLLAGGQSRRMGRNKAFIRLDGETIIERALRVLKTEFPLVFIAANDASIYEGLSTRVVVDIYRGAGSLGGVYTALFHSPTEYAFVTACDMPFLDRDCIRVVTEAAGGYDAAAPVIGGRLHPLHAVYSRKCLKPIEEMIKSGKLRINDLFERIRYRPLDEGFFVKGGKLPIELSVTNVNTPEELRSIMEKAER